MTKKHYCRRSWERRNTFKTENKTISRKSIGGTYGTDNEICIEIWLSRGYYGWVSETLKPNPGNLIRNGGIIYRIGCGMCDKECPVFRKSDAMRAVTEGETNGYCEQVVFDKAKDPPVWIVDVLEDSAFAGQPVIVFC
ncbi:MAG: hypothetical protein WCV86_05610, partial [Patescibacteria group bacterium]